MDILKQTLNKTFNQKTFKHNLKKTNIIKNIKIKPQNYKGCHVNNNQEVVVQLSNKNYITQPQNVILKRNFFLTLKKNYNNNLLYSTVLSKHLYKIRFNNFINFFRCNENNVIGRILPFERLKNFTLNLGFQGLRVTTSLFELIPRIKRFKKAKKIKKNLKVFFNKTLYFKNKGLMNNHKQIVFSRKDYFLTK